MQRQEITDDVALAEEIERLLLEAEENGVPADEQREVLERQKQFVNG